MLDDLSLILEFLRELKLMSYCWNSKLDLEVTMLTMLGDSNIGSSRSSGSGPEVVLGQILNSFAALLRSSLVLSNFATWMAEMSASLPELIVQQLVDGTLLKMTMARGGNSTSLSSDLLYDIFRRLDGPSLARAACTCADFSSISKDEELWENASRSLWPSTDRDNVRSLISSIGGFRRFYADCFPLIVNEGVPAVQFDSNLPYPDEWAEADYYGDNEEIESISPSDFISIVDVRYKEKAIFSKVIWGIPADGYNSWFHNCPFRFDLLNYPDRDNGDETKEVILSIDDGLPLIASVERERKDGKLWRELYDGIKLSWIIVNKRLNQAANLASWSPLGGQRHWPTDQNFLLRFGSILPAKDILPCQVTECIFVMKLSIVNVGNATTLRLTELSMQLEDVAGAHVNGRNSLLVLKEALSCRRSWNYSEVLESCHLYLKARSELKEEKMKNESWFDRFYIISSIAIVGACCYCIL